MNIQELMEKKNLNLSAQFKAAYDFFSTESYNGTQMEKFIENFSPKYNDHEEQSLNDSDLFLINGKNIKSPSRSGLKVRAMEKGDLDLLKNDSPINSLQHSLCESGVVVEIDETFESEVPLTIHHLTSTSTLQTPIVIIRLKKFSKATLIENNLDESNDHFSLGETHLFLEENSNLEHVQVHSLNGRSLQHSSTYSNVSAHASYTNYLFHLNGGLNRSNLELSLLGPLAHGENLSLFLTSENEHSDIQTKILHHSEDSTSAQVAKGLLGGKSRGIFTGKIHIFPNAQRVSSSQINRNLLLSNKAQVHSRPQLEIFADDVKCSHGSTTGQLSQDEIFYFETRGIPENLARHLIAYGFGQEIVLKIKNKLAQEKIKKLVQVALLKKHQIGE